jgi:HK97 family phage portal protein
MNTPATEDNRRPRVDMWVIRDAKGMQYPVLPADMVHSKLFHPLDPIYGMAPLEAAMLQVDAQNEGATLMKRMLQGGFAPGWIEAAEDSEWSDTQVAQLRERLRRSRESGEALWLQNAKWHEMGFPPVDSGVAEQQVLSKRDIASVFHVPSQLIGDTQSQTYSNYYSARQALYMEAVWPLLTQFRDDLNRTVGRDLKSEMEFDKDSFDAIAAARTEAADRVHKLWTAGLITQNEGRRDLEYDTVQGGDVFYAPANFLPLGGEVAPEAPES